MMPPGGLRHIGWRFIHPSAWKVNSAKFRIVPVLCGRISYPYLGHEIVQRTTYSSCPRIPATSGESRRIRTIKSQLGTRPRKAK
jgi:hypothetical protein